MHKIAYTLLALPLMLLGGVAQAQTAGTVTFTANKTSATGSLTPVLTWSTTPVASSCTAGGAWSGTKFASGSETVATITASKSYTLTCSWGNGSAKITWTAPTKNTDGTALTNLAGFKVLFGNSSGALNQSVSVSDPKATSTTINALGAGTWYFAVRAVNAGGSESANSSVGQKTVTAVTAAKTVNITISGSTTTQRHTIGTRVYDVVLKSDGTHLLGTYVGTIPLGKPCSQTYSIAGTNYWRVDRTYVTLTKTPRSSSVVASCS